MQNKGPQFTTIRTEGAMLPADILQRIATERIEGMKPADYGLPKSVKLNEAISRDWTRALDHWKDFKEAREAIPSGDAGTTQTHKNWHSPLLEILGFGKIPRTKAPEIEGKSYPIQYFWQSVPLHLLGFGVPIDTRSAGVTGAASSRPHSLVQEYLNRSDEHLWAIVTNGLQLRLLRDNLSLSRQAFVEFDLETMMDNEVYSDFVIFWLVCHVTRFDANRPEECWLEKWSHLSSEFGARILEDLNNGVVEAIQHLGQGFIGHLANDALRDSLRSGELDKQELYRETLRIVYRLLFLFVAEDRDLLHPPDTKAEAKRIYRTHYSTASLRQQADRIRGTSHGDLWHTLSLIFSKLGDEGCPELGLPGLGSFLWSTESTPHLLGPGQVARNDPHVELDNESLLGAIRALAYAQVDGLHRSVDYRNLGAEELGSVYEGLLELVPNVVAAQTAESSRFDLLTTAGNERKTSGSYYTPDSLVQCLLDSALDPVVEDRLKGKRGQDAEQAILSMKVCDPACGSGHFLIAAAHRMARHLARIRTGEREPSPEDHQQALRDVIGLCIYGVDINPMAVELCKVSLWIEAIEPGKPLSFLDSHIQCGNSLLGTTPKLLADGIPDDAFNPIEGDDKKFTADLKKRNKAERKDRLQGQKSLFSSQDEGASLASQFSELSGLDDSTVDAVAKKERLHADLVASSDYQDSLLIADTWCSAFVWKKDDSDNGKLCPTDQDFAELKENPASASQGLKSGVRSLSRKYQFFHWYLAFPDVFVLTKEETAENQQTGWNAGFDVVLGNPPWEKIHLRDEEFFAGRVPDIAKAPTKAKRKRLIGALCDDDPGLFAEYRSEQQKHDHISAFFRMSGYFPLTGVSRINLYSVFAETAHRVVNGRGRFGLVLASGILTDDNNKHYFDKLISSEQLVHAWDFENSKAIFPGVHRSYKFALLCGCGPQARVEQADFAFYLTSVLDLQCAGKHFSLSAHELALLNPNTKACPAFRSRADVLLALYIYKRIPPVDTLKSDSDWPGDIKTPFNSANDSRFFKNWGQLQDEQAELSLELAATVDGETWLPIYEPKFIHQFSHRFATFASDGDISKSQGIETTALCSPTKYVIPRNWLPSTLLAERFPGNWFVVIRNITGALNERTSISAIIPKRPCVDANLLLRLEPHTALLSCANLNAFVYDYLARQKIAGTHFNQFIWKQIPLVRPADYSDRGQPRCVDFMVLRALELTYTAWDLEPFAQDCGYDGPPFCWDEKRRFLLRCELDAAFFHLYLGTSEEWQQATPKLLEAFPNPREAVAYIMETFPIVKRKDIARTEVKDDKGEVTTEGTYITKDTILAIYDEMQRAIDSGQPYQTRLDSPPGPPTDADGNFISMAQWDKAKWPPHIHPPRKEVKV